MPINQNRINAQSLFNNPAHPLYDLSFVEQANAFITPRTNILSAQSLLGLTDNFTHAELRANLKMLRIYFHPDKNLHHSHLASKAFKGLGQAADYLAFRFRHTLELSDEELRTKKQEYDANPYREENVEILRQARLHHFFNFRAAHRPNTFNIPENKLTRRQ